MKQYRKINGDGFVNNSMIKEGEIISLDPKQARYLIAPLGSVLEEVKSNKGEVVGVGRLPKVSSEPDIA